MDSSIANSNAATIVTNLQLPSADGHSDVGSYLNAIKSELFEIRSHIYSRVQDNREIFESALEETTHLNARLRHLQNELKFVHQRIVDPETSLHCLLIDSTKRRNDLLASERHKSIIIKVLQALSDVRNSINQMEGLIKAHQIWKALQLSKSISLHIERLPGAFPLSSQPKIYNELKLEYGRVSFELMRAVEGWYFESHVLRTDSLPQSFSLDISIPKLDPSSISQFLSTNPMRPPAESSTPLPPSTSTSSTNSSNSASNTSVSGSTSSSSYDFTSYHLSLSHCMASLQSLGTAESKIQDFSQKLTKFIDLVIPDPEKSPYLSVVSVSLKQSIHGRTASLHATIQSNTANISTPMSQSEQNNQDHISPSKPSYLGGIKMIEIGMSHVLEIFRFLEFTVVQPLNAIYQEDPSLLDSSLASLSTMPIMRSSYENPDTKRMQAASSASSPLSGMQLAKRIGEAIIPYAIDRLIRCCFDPSIQEQGASITNETKVKIGQWTDHFVPTLARLGFLDETPHRESKDKHSHRSSSSKSSDSVSKMLTYLKDYHLQVVQKRRRVALGKVRNLITSLQVDSILVGDSSDLSDLQSSLNETGQIIFVSFPECKVRNVVVQLVDLCYKILNDAMVEVDTTNKMVYLQTVRDILDLYRAIVPHLEERRINQVPGLAMLFHNDCQYIAHHLCLFTAKFQSLELTPLGTVEESPPTDSQNSASSSGFVQPLTLSNANIEPPPLDASQELANVRQNSSASVGASSPTQTVFFSFADLVPCFRSMGEDLYHSVVQGVQRDLEALLDGFGGFADVANPNNSSRCSKVAKHVLAKLESVDAMWAPTLPLPLHMVTMGHLVNFVTTFILQRLLDITDIGVDETEILHQIFTSLLPLAKIFLTAPGAVIDDPKVCCSTYVKSWSTFENVTDIMVMSMVDIVKNFNDGMFDLRKEEVEHLITSIFQDSPKRRDQLAMLHD